VKRARELIYTAERQASRDVSLAGLRLKPGSSQIRSLNNSGCIQRKKRVLLRVVALLFGLGHRGGVRRSFARVLKAVKAMVVKL
jgi:hypothetical protein